MASQAGNFRHNWVQTAIVLPDDTVAQAKWNSINDSISTNLSVKGTVKGNFSDLTPTYCPLDTFVGGLSTSPTPKLADLPPDIVVVPEPNSLGYGFDDGPNCSHNAFYDFLTQQQQEASTSSSYISSVRTLTNYHVQLCTTLAVTFRTGL